jgi:hypothetical protein
VPVVANNTSSHIASSPHPARIMAQDDELRIKGAAHSSNVPPSMSAGPPEQSEKDDEKADHPEQAEEVSPDTITIWSPDYSLRTHALDAIRRSCSSVMLLSSHLAM